MPSITVDERGNSLYYIDSGEPQKRDGEKPYTTMIFVHGTAFHGGTFQRLLPLARKYCMRFVIVNRRHYPGSSPYSDEELDKIKHGDPEAQTVFAKDRAREYANFMKSFVQQNGVPPIDEDGKSGGVVLMAWSGGTYYALQILAFADALDIETRSAIEPFFRSFMMFEPSPWTVGCVVPESGINVVMRDPSLPIEERLRRFSTHVAGYYSHKNLNSRNCDDLQHDLVPGTHPSWIPVMSPNQAEQLTCADAVSQSEVLIPKAKPELYTSFVRRALCEPAALSCFPKCRIDLVWCENSAWECIIPLWTIQRLVEDANEMKIRHKQFKATMIPGPGSNHFIFWDEPEKAMKYFAEIISA